MSDLTAAPEAPAAADAPAPAPEAPVTEAPVTDAPEGGEATGFAVEASLDGDLPEGVDRFDRGYVQKIREEAAKYRTEYKPFKEAFDGYEPEDRDALLGLARELLENPEAAARRMLDASRSIAGDDFDKWLNPVEPEYLTPETLERQLAEREEKSRQAAEVAAIQREAVDLGYSEGTADHAKLFFYAANETQGDIKAAHAKMEAEKQGIIDTYVASVKEKGGRFPATPVNVQGVATGAIIAEGAPKTFAEAAARARQRLAEMPD